MGWYTNRVGDSLLDWKTVRNYNKLFSDENKCIKIEIVVEQFYIVKSTDEKIRKYRNGGSYDEENRNVDERW